MKNMKNMKKKFISLTPYLALLAIDFYLLPFAVKDTGTAMLLMLCVMPLAAFVAAVACGVRKGFCVMLPVGAFLLFIPTIFIHYNASAWVYAPVYAVIVLAGNAVGRAFYGKR